MRIDRALASVLALVALAVTPAIADDVGYLRYPDLHGDQVVFTAEGDLWSSSLNGGPARRLTHHPSEERLAQFSPDGRQIAFSASYDGNPDVYVISADGGEARRLTWHPGNDEVLGWSPDGRHVIFRSRRAQAHRSWELYRVPVSGGDAERLPLGWASRLSEDPESGQWAFTRINRELRPWKRYRGGMAARIWVGDPKTANFRELSEFPGMNAFPMWHGGRIYFLSDRGGTANIWSMNSDGSDRTQHTTLDVWDARFPSLADDGRIVFMLAGGLRVLDLESGRVSEVTVDLPSDRTRTRVRHANAARTVDWFDLSPDGERVVVVTRGEVFSVPVEKGPTLPVTRGSGARERTASYDPTGKRLVYVTDEPREEEIRSADAWGRGDVRVLRKAGTSGRFFAPVYAPDGKHLAFADQTQSLFVSDLEGGEPQLVERAAESEIRRFAFSPDGKWLAYSYEESNHYHSVFLYELATGKKVRVTDASTSDYAPAWDPEGRYLYFLSDRFTNPLLGARDFENIDVKPTKIYAVLLTAKTPHPLAELAGLPKDEDEKDGDKKDEKKDAKKASKKKGAKDESSEEKKDDAPKPVKIDVAGLAGRVVELPVPAGNYNALSASKSHLFFISYPLRGMGESPSDYFGDPAPTSTLMSYDIKKKKTKPFVEGVGAYELKAKAGKVALMKRRGEIYVVSAAAPPGPKLGEARLGLSGIIVEVEPRAEWEQIYYEAWRQMRDFYWDAGIAGVPWEKIRDQYATLLPRLATRGDLNDLIAEMIGELSTSHSYVFGGDLERGGARISIGMLGADVTRDGDAYRIERIYRGSAPDRERSPLLEPGLGLAEGHFIFSVNHRPFREDESFLAAFAGLAGKKVVLEVGAVNEREKARRVVVTPLGSEGPLRYADWVRQNREYVLEKSGGKIGYIHVPNMGSEGLIEFNTWFFPQLDKEGMVVDVRWNGGGFVSQLLLNRLQRKLLSFDRTRQGGVSTYPASVLNGPFVVLTNQFAGSDGDIFPAAVQLAGLAPVIGMRSWGGVVGIRADKRLVDGGLVTQPEFAWWDPRDGWALENRGVEPDIELDNLPQDLARGVDAQLDRAIEEVLALHAKTPPVKPNFEPARKRSREDYRSELP